MNENNRVDRRFYPDGKVQSELAYLNGSTTSWIARMWHPNGVLGSEIPVRDGLPEGSVCFWNANGELLGSYEMYDGTGVMKSWHPNGILMGETSFLRGKYHGRQTAYFEDGEFIQATYWIQGKQVSKKKYVEAALKDPSFPQYDSWPKAKRIKPRIGGKFNPGSSCVTDTDNAFALKLIASAGTREVLEWLQSGRPGTRILGELPTTESSISVAKKFYTLGAIKVWAVEIDGSDPEMEGTGKLVLHLPEESLARKGLFKLCGQWARKQGYEPELDKGQEYIFLALD